MVNDERSLAEDTFNRLEKIEKRVELLERNTTAVADKLNEIILVLNDSIGRIKNDNINH